MAATKRHRRKSSSHGHRRRRRATTNPVAPHRRRRARRNPGRSMASGVGSYFTNSLWLIGGGLGTRLGTEAVLGAGNTGILGYGANVLTAVILGWAVGKGMKNRSAGASVTLGGILATVLRIVQEKTPFGQYAQQAFGQSGIGDLGVGEYITGPFFQPMQIQNTQWPNQTLPAVIQNLQRPAAAPMRGIGARSGDARMDMSRF